MAGGSVKRTAERNAEHLKMLLYGMIGANLLHVFLRHFLRPRPLISGASFMFLITLAPSFGIWRFLNELGKPQRDSRNFLRPAQDIAAAKGPIEWAHDVLYIIWGLSVMTPLLGYKFYWFLLVVPGYAGYRIWDKFGPQIAQRAKQLQAEGVEATAARVRTAAAQANNTNGAGADNAANAAAAEELSKTQAKKRAKQEKLEKAQRNMRR